jgi:hypothetical protein
MLRYSLYSEDQIREPDLFEVYSSDNSSAAENQQERLIKIGGSPVTSTEKVAFQST